MFYNFIKRFTYTLKTNVGTELALLLVCLHVAFVSFLNISASQCLGMGRGRGGPGPPIILIGTFNLVRGHAFHAALFISMCSFRLDKASKLFIYGFNKEKLL